MARASPTIEVKPVVTSKPKRGQEITSRTINTDKPEVYHEGYVNGKRYLVPDTNLEAMKDVINLTMRPRKSTRYKHQTSYEVADYEHFQQKVNKLLTKIDEVSLSSSDDSDISDITEKSYKKKEEKEKVSSKEENGSSSERKEEESLPSTESSFEISEGEDVHPRKKSYDSKHEKKLHHKEESYNRSEEEENLSNEGSSKISEKEYLPTREKSSKTTLGENMPYEGSKEQTAPTTKKASESSEEGKGLSQQKISQINEEGKMPSNNESSESNGDRKVLSKEGSPESKGIKEELPIPSFREGLNYMPSQKYHKQIEEETMIEEKKTIRVEGTPVLESDPKIIPVEDKVKKTDKKVVEDSLESLNDFRVRFLVSGHFKNGNTPMYIIHDYDEKFDLFNDQKADFVSVKRTDAADIFLYGRTYTENILFESEGRPMFLNTKPNKLSIRPETCKIFYDYFESVFPLEVADIILRGEFIRTETINKITPLLSFGIMPKDHTTPNINNENYQIPNQETMIYYVTGPTSNPFWRSIDRRYDHFEKNKWLSSKLFNCLNRDVRKTKRKNSSKTLCHLLKYFTW